MTTYRCPKEEDTVQAGREIGGQLKSPCVILLYGDLGAGKTVLTRGLVEGLGFSDSHQVHSPTFTLVNQYRHDDHLLVHHIDLYRLETLKDLQSIGLEEILGGDSVVIVEWAERIPFPVPAALRIQIDFEPTSATRHIRVENPSESAPPS